LVDALERAADAHFVLELDRDLVVHECFEETGKPSISLSALHRITPVFLLQQVWSLWFWTAHKNRRTIST
jgi:hypothetical protein